MEALGRHLLTEFCGCNREVLNNSEVIQTCMEHATAAAGATVVKSVFHLLSSHGVSGVVVTEEAHLAIRTWPEYGYAAVDLFACGECVDPWKACTHLKEKLCAVDVSTVEMKRGRLDFVNR